MQKDMEGLELSSFLQTRGMPSSFNMSSNPLDVG